MWKYVQNQIEEKINLSERSSLGNILCWHSRSCLTIDAIHECIQWNIYQNLILLYKTHTGAASSIFFNKFSKINHNYLTSSKSISNYTFLKSAMITNFSISRRGPILWNTVLDTILKEIEYLPLFKVKVKENFLSHD